MRVVLLSPLIVLAGCGLSPVARALLTDGQSAYDRRDYDEAVLKLSAFLKEAGQAPEARRALYIRGSAHAAAGRRTQARSDFSRAVTSAGEADVAWRAQVALGSLQFEDGDWPAAAEAYAAAAESMPRTPPMDFVIYRLGQCRQRTGNWPAGRAAFERLLRDFSRSPYVEQVRRQVARGPTSFSIQCGTFTRARNADELRAKLAAAGLAARVESESRGGEAVQVVWVGSYAKYDEAVRELSRVRAVAGDAIIWP
ncbi:MAG: hypothetical protein CHACPFDD_01512 [Phycisphaerae bacterium]|nr:hypothetical protein [Phycisphaerae bacterium]